MGHELGETNWIRFNRTILKTINRRRKNCIGHRIRVKHCFSRCKRWNDIVGNIKGRRKRRQIQIHADYETMKNQEGKIKKVNQRTKQMDRRFPFSLFRLRCYFNSDIFHPTENPTPLWTSTFVIMFGVILTQVRMGTLDGWRMS